MINALNKVLVCNGKPEPSSATGKAPYLTIVTVDLHPGYEHPGYDPIWD